MSGNWIEPLDRRVLLSAQLVGTTLVLTGTESNDTISAAVDPRFINVMDATVNGVTNYFSLAAVRQLDIKALGGDDRIDIDLGNDTALEVASSGFSITSPPPTVENTLLYDFPVVISGGTGNDRISAGEEDDVIDAGDGSDKVYANGGQDSVLGGAGNDTMYGGDGDDTLLGGVGTDRLIGEGGYDVCDGGKGSNFIDGGDGNDVIKETTGSDTVYAGAGDDSGTFKGGGIVYGEVGKDTFVSTGTALLYGGDGNDNLQGTSVWGDAGDDTLAGLNGADVIHGGDGNDLIRGMDGADTLYGEGGDDAIFGGGGTDSLFGGDGNDNLYGTNGAKDKHKDLDGTDDATGGAGSDWFETDYPWRKGDYTKGVDRPVGSQNPLGQDPDVGLYSGGTLTIGSNNGTGSIVVNSSAEFSGVTVTGGTIQFTNGGVGSTVTVNQQLGKIAWVSTGVWDGGTGFTPPALAHTDRLAMRSGIVQLLANWHLSAMTSTGDNIVWYGLTGGTSGLSGTPDWRFLAVKRGTVLIDQTDTSLATSLGPPKVFDLSTTELPIAADANISLAGSATIYHSADTFDSLPTDGPAGARGILLSGGVIWLPGDGTAPSFETT